MRPCLPALGLVFMLSHSACWMMQDDEDANADATGDRSGDRSGDGEAHCEDPPTAAEGCSPNRDFCVSVDEVTRCDAQAQAQTYRCAELCAPTLGFTCTWTGSQSAACWCVSPGRHRGLGCPELEACVERCQIRDDQACEDQCFARATAATIALLGDLYYCAEARCLESCEANANGCNQCRAAARSGATAACASERVLCDADSVDAGAVTGGWPE